MANTITMGPAGLSVPDDPIIPFIEGDGTGPDIWAAAVRVLEAAVDKAYSGAKKIEWMEVTAGEKAYNSTGAWLPDETVEAFRHHLVGIKGPLTTPIGGGIRSLNVALRQTLDLYACLRPVRWFQGVPSQSVNPNSSTWSSSGKTQKTCMPGRSWKKGAKGPSACSSFSTPSSAGRSGPTPVSGSSQFRSMARSAWSERRSNTP